MSTSTPGPGGGGVRPPFDPVGRPGAPASERQTPQPAGTAAPDRPPAGGPTARRRPPLWLVAVAAVLVAGLGVVAVLVLSNRGGGIVPEAEVITLPVPTPTIEPMVREPVTAFADALPSTVLQLALTELAAEPTVLAAGALEGYRLVYSDGGTLTLVGTAGQWATVEAATTAASALVAAQVAAAGADADPVQEGPVLVDGTEVGRYSLVPRADGTGTITWTNQSVVLQLDGPADSLLDVHTAFTL
ncbi:MAG TPA: hypothetical protein PLS68_11090 [Actinotalea sp.]|nr:hypothetical protein [Actinotalea sp.]